MSSDYPICILICPISDSADSFAPVNVECSSNTIQESWSWADYESYFDSFSKILAALQ